MKIRVRYNSIVPRIMGFGLFKINGIVIYPFVFIRRNKKDALEKKLINHEYIHIMQMRKEGIIKYYIKWFYEGIRNLVKYRNWKKAYKNISYEKEAFEKQDSIEIPESWK